MAVSATARNLPGICGPGGLSCPCCTDWNPRRDMRRVRRTIRRTSRVNVRDYR